MIRKFVNREFELNSLNKKFSEQKLNFIIIYGRRRVGKTELIKKFCEGKQSLYFLADKRGTEQNLSRMAKLAAAHFKDIEPNVKGFDELFAYIMKRSNGKKMVIAIDEFSYLVEKDDSIPSVFQLVVDEVINNSNMLLILSGSSISMMESLLASKSPLYGRRTGHFKLNPFNLKHIQEFFPNKNIEEIIKIYAVTGGIPYYCSLIDPNKDIFENISNEILSKDGKLYEEVEFLLNEEFRDSATYENILESMATGLATLTKIANHAGMNAKDASSYLKTLVNLKIVRKEKPITEKKRKKTSLYFIEDNFFKFWFKFAKPNLSYLESGNSSEILKLTKKDFNHYISKHVFEPVCREFVSQTMPLKLNDVGRWWHKDKEIDIVGINEEAKEILFAECKWQDNVDAVQVLEELKEKAKHVDWNNSSRKESYAVFAKSFSKKTKGAHLYDLKCMRK